MLVVPLPGGRCCRAALPCPPVAARRRRRPQKRAGAKGFGLFAGEDLKAGAFLIEYLGEVLEEEEYARR